MTQYTHLQTNLSSILLDKGIRRLGLFLIFILQFAICNPSWSANPTLVRLSFPISPEQRTEFDTVYHEEITPILQTHGLHESTQKTRQGSDHYFSRLFELKTPEDIPLKTEALQSDTTFATLLQNLGKRFAHSNNRELLQHEFGLYSAPATGRILPTPSGKTIQAGSGTGFWRSFTRENGLPHNNVAEIFQDREGYLWLGTGGGGVSKFDGQTFANLSVEDGLADNTVPAITQDRQGNMWFGTYGGVSKFDGQTFTTLTTADGLPDNNIQAILQDRDEQLWFGTREGGVSRYDGQKFYAFNQNNDLMNTPVWSIYEDRHGHLWFGAEWGVSRYDPSQNQTTIGSAQTAFTNFTTTDAMGIKDGGPVVMSILGDPKGTLWFSLHGTGISHYDPSLNRSPSGHQKPFTILTPEDGLIDQWSMGMAQDSQGAIWVGAHGGVTRYEPNSEQKK